MDVCDLQDRAGERRALPEVWEEPTPFLIVGADVCLDEGKAIGTAQLRANVGARDAALRTRSLGARTMQRTQIREAGTNAGRSLKRITARTRLQVLPVLRELQQGSLGLREAQERSAALWRQAYESVREVGRRASGLDRIPGADSTIYREEETWFRGAVREELSYWNTFLAEVSVGDVDEDRAAERFENYLKALRFMFESARVQALPDNVLLYWSGPVDERNCPGCAYMMERSPFTKDNIPAVPRDGTCRCLTNCRHRLVVRLPAMIEDVYRRRHDLPKRSTMLRELKELSVRTDTVRASQRARNPFRGEPITAPPPQRPFTYRGRRVRVTRTGFVRESLQEAKALRGTPPGMTIVRAPNFRTTGTYDVTWEHPSGRVLRTEMYRDPDTGYWNWMGSMVNRLRYGADLLGFNRREAIDKLATLEPDHPAWVQESVTERVKPSGDADSGSRGKQFEAWFVRALNLLGLRHKENRATGAAWDIKPQGKGWHRLVKDQEVNIKIHGTRWLFSERAIYLKLQRAVRDYQRGKIDADRANKRVENAVRKALSAKAIPAAVFMKPGSRAIEDAIKAAAAESNVDLLHDLMVAKNFKTKRLGRSYRLEVSCDWDAFDSEVEFGPKAAPAPGSWQKTVNIRIDGGADGKRFGITGRVERAGGILTLFFRDRSSLGGKPAHAARVESVRVDERIAREGQWALVRGADPSYQLDVFPSGFWAYSLHNTEALAITKARRLRLAPGTWAVMPAPQGQRAPGDWMGPPPGLRAESFALQERVALTTGWMANLAKKATQDKLKGARIVGMPQGGGKYHMEFLLTPSFEGADTQAKARAVRVGSFGRRRWQKRWRVTKMLVTHGSDEPYEITTAAGRVVKVPATGGLSYQPMGHKNYEGFLPAISAVKKQVGRNADTVELMESLQRVHEFLTEALTEVSAAELADPFRSHSPTRHKSAAYLRYKAAQRKRNKEAAKKRSKLMHRYRRPGRGKLDPDMLRLMGLDPDEVGEVVEDEDALYDPALATAVKRKGFPDVATARTAVQALQHAKAAKKLPKKMKRKLTAPKGAHDGDGMELLYDAIDEAVYYQSLTEAVSPTFDSVPYSSMRLQDVARLFDAATKGRNLNTPALLKLASRLIAALEFSAMATIGRPEADRMSRLLRGALDRLASRLSLSEHYELRRLDVLCD